MGTKLMKLILFKTTILNFEDFMEKNNLRGDTMNEPQLQRITIYPTYPKESKIYSKRGFVKWDNGSMGGTQWTCFIVKITNHTTLTHSEELQINFNLTNHLNQ